MTLTREVQNKLKTLELELAKLPGLVIGFSGGVDSSLLVTVAHEVLGNKMLAVTIDSAFCPRREMAEATGIAKLKGMEHQVVKLNPLVDKTVAANPPERCYYCKKLVFSKLVEIAQEKGFAYIADGSNVDDDKDYRPGMKALKELKVISPLKLAGLSKADIRAISEALQLPTWQKESAACLASRIPYGEEITEKKLRQIEAAEEVLAPLKLSHLRVRLHGTIARIEVGQEDFAKIMEIQTRRAAVADLKKLGFQYVTLDLEGYRMGSLNELLHK